MIFNFWKSFTTALKIHFLNCKQYVITWVNIFHFGLNAPSYKCILGLSYQNYALYLFHSLLPSSAAFKALVKFWNFLMYIHVSLFLFLSPLLNNKPWAGTKILFLFQSLASIKSLSFKLLSKFLLKELINNECTKKVVQISIDSLLFLSTYSLFLVYYYSVSSFSWLFTWEIWPGRQKFTVLPRTEKTIWRLP